MNVNSVLCRPKSTNQRQEVKGQKDVRSFMARFHNQAPLSASFCGHLLVLGQLPLGPPSRKNRSTEIACRCTNASHSNTSWWTWQRYVSHLVCSGLGRAIFLHETAQCRMATKTEPYVPLPISSFSDNSDHSNSGRLPVWRLKEPLRLCRTGSLKAMLFTSQNCRKPADWGWLTAWERCYTRFSHIKFA